MIYTASREDLPKVLEMVLKIPQEMSGFDEFPETDVEKVTEWLFSNWLKWPIFVYKEEGILKGLVGVQVTQFWWSTKDVVNDYAFYIDPQHRSLKVIGALIEAMRDFAKINKMPCVSNFISSKGTDTKLKLFERKGFKQAGFIAAYGV